jgi:2-polyprenyl-3-methyl-5-hydroxy-6-metoxy-1,4-benzoquinol methylase
MKTLSISLKCPACGHNSKTQPGRFLSRSGFYYHLEKCSNCGFQFKVTEDNLSKIYKFVYDTGEYINDRGASSVNRPERSYVPYFLKNHVTAGGLVLEIGPGAAGNLLYAKDIGFRTATLDVSEWNNTYFKNTCGFDHVYSSMESIPNESLDGVIATHVIEHVQRPFEFLKALRTKMKQGARLLIGTPNCGFPYTTFFGNRWWVYGVDDHVSFFQSGNLEKLLKLAGFQDILVKSCNSNGCHSLSWFLKWGIRGYPYGFRSRVATTANSNATEAKQITPSATNSTCNRKAGSTGSRIKRMLDFPFATLAKAGYGYELVAICRR